MTTFTIRSEAGARSMETIKKPDPVCLRRIFSTKLSVRRTKFDFVYYFCKNANT